MTTKAPHSPAWRVTFFLAVAGALNYADRSAFASVLAPLRADLHLSDAALGWLSSIFSFGYALSSPLAGMLADRYSRSRMIILSLAGWSFFMTLTGCTGSLLLLCLCRLGLGLGESPFHPAAFALVADHHPAIRRARAMSVLSMGFQLGTVAGGTAAGFIASHLGWRAGFWVLGGLGILLALVARFFVCDAAQPAAGPRATISREALAFLVRNPSYHLIVAKQLLAEASTWMFIAWLPLYLYDTYGMALAAAGFFGSVVLSLPMVAGILGGGWFSDACARRSGKYRMLVLGLCYFLGAPLTLVFLLRPGFITVMVTVTVWTLLRGIGGASERPATCEVVPAPYRATAFGIMNFFANGSGAVGALMAGLLKKSVGLNTVFASSSVLFVITGASLIVGTYVCMPKDMARTQALESA